MRLIALIALLLAAPLWAQQSPKRPGLPPLAVGEAARWPAIGRVNGAGYRTMSHCTGTLVAPDVVLTAAHCTPAPGDPPDRIFVAGYIRGDYFAKSTVIRGERHPAYHGDHNIRFDVGLLFLDPPMLSIRPMPLADPRAETFALLGYHRARPHMLSGRFDCPLINATLVTMQLGCEVISGNSGGPVLQREEDGTWSLVGVVSSQWKDTALATRPSDWVLRTVESHLKAKASGQ